MVEINFLPWREILWQQKKRERWIEIIAAVFFSFLIILLAHLILENQWTKIKARLELMQIRVERVNKTLAEVKELYPSLSYQKIPEIDLDIILRQQERILHFLQEMAKEMPVSIYLQELHFEKNTWHLEGVSADLHSILHYLEQLRALKEVDIKKQNFLDIKQKEGFFYFKFQLEPLA